jgi:ABC-type dipeptide/oligopeptide/nickel transport system permease component
MRDTSSIFYYNDVSKQIFELCWNYFKCIFLVLFLIWITGIAILALIDCYKNTFNRQQQDDNVIEQ